MIPNKSFRKGPVGYGASELKDIDDDSCLESKEESKDIVQQMIRDALGAIEKTNNPDDYVVNVVLVSICKR